MKTRATNDARQAAEDVERAPAAEEGAGFSCQSRVTRHGQIGFTLIEVMIAIIILSLVILAIFSSWTAIIRASKVGLSTAAAVQRERIAMRVIEDSLASAQMFAVNANYYAFVAENGTEATLSFVARLSKSFPRSGKFGDLDVRRVTFSIEPGGTYEKQLVMRQNPILMEVDDDEKEHPVVLAREVKEFSVEFWDPRLNDWIDEWAQTNQLPKLVKISMRLASEDSHSSQPEEIIRVVGLPTAGVQPGWQTPALQGAPGGSGGAGGRGTGTGNPSGNPGGRSGGIIKQVQ